MIFEIVVGVIGYLFRFFFGWFRWITFDDFFERISRPRHLTEPRRSRREKKPEDSPIPEFKREGQYDLPWPSELGPPPDDLELRQSEDAP